MKICQRTQNWILHFSTLNPTRILAFWRKFPSLARRKILSNFECWCIAEIRTIYWAQNYIWIDFPGLWDIKCKQHYAIYKYVVCPSQYNRKLYQSSFLPCTRGFPLGLQLMGVGEGTNGQMNWTNGQGLSIKWGGTNGSGGGGGISTSWVQSRVQLELNLVNMFTMI